MEELGGVALIIGACFVLLAGVGVVRFPDVFSRLHAAAKGPTIGLMFTGLGVSLSVRTLDVIVTVVLVVVLQVIAGPVGTHIIGRSVYRRGGHGLDTDELADAEDLP